MRFVGPPRRASVLALSVLLTLTFAVPAAASSSAGDADNPPDPVGGTGSFSLSASSFGSGYAPPFIGNGELGIRVPAAGQGSDSSWVPVEGQLAGFYAQMPGAVQQRADIPTWTSLGFSDGGSAFAPGLGTWRKWRQTLDLRTGTITTAVEWTAPDGHVSDLTYQVLTDRARQGVGVVRLTLVPRWTGTATVADTVDGSRATLSTQVGKGWLPAEHGDWIAIRAVGTGIGAVVASQLSTSSDVRASTSPVDGTVDQSVGQQLAFTVEAGRSYTFTKYVGIASQAAGRSPDVLARGQAADAAAQGFGALVATNDSAWATLWKGRVDVLGNDRLATEVNASEFYLWSSVRDGVDWSASPGGLSSSGYNGHVFWDAETWMYPALLAQHPDLAAGMDAYRFARLGTAESHASGTGYSGARFPWESALDGNEQIPPPASLFSEGLYEQHVTADVALAQWQYYEATGDRQWLATRGWPVLSAAAAFWASRVVPGKGGTFHIDGVTGPDEENPNVDDEVYTNAAAATVLRDAMAAARALGKPVPATWAPIAAHLVVPVDTADGVNPEFAGYQGQTVKQADATLLEYPLGFAQPSAVAAADLDYYVPRTDPAGPSMTDAINSIDTSALGSPGCASYVFTARSVAPFVRDPFDQFSETRSGGVLTFVTGIGGFLQEFLYGYSGLRWDSGAVDVAPTLTAPLTGVVLHGLAWHGRRFDVAIGPRHTVVTVQSGGGLPVRVGSATHVVPVAGSLTVATRRPDLGPSSDAARCGQASATSAQPGGPPLAAVDGSPSTGWQPVAVPAALTVVVAGGARTIRTATLTWGQQWPGQPSPTVAPPPGPVMTLRATAYTVAVSADGTTWRTVASVSGRTTGTSDVLSFPAVTARQVRVAVTAAGPGVVPVLDELVVTG